MPSAAALLDLLGFGSRTLQKLLPRQLKHLRQPIRYTLRLLESLRTTAGAAQTLGITVDDFLRSIAPPVPIQDLIGCDSIAVSRKAFRDQELTTLMDFDDPTEPILAEEATEAALEAMMAEERARAGGPVGGGPRLSGAGRKNVDGDGDEEDSESWRLRRGHELAEMLRPDLGDDDIEGQGLQGRGRRRKPDHAGKGGRGRKGDAAEPFPAVHPRFVRYDLNSDARKRESGGPGEGEIGVDTSRDATGGELRVSLDPGADGNSEDSNDGRKGGMEVSREQGEDRARFFAEASGSEYSSNSSDSSDSPSPGKSKESEPASSAGSPTGSSPRSVVHGAPAAAPARPPRSGKLSIELPRTDSESGGEIELPRQTGRNSPPEKKGAAANGSGQVEASLGALGGSGVSGASGASGAPAEASHDARPQPQGMRQSASYQELLGTKKAVEADKTYFRALQEDKVMDLEADHAFIFVTAVLSSKKPFYSLFSIIYSIFYSKLHGTSPVSPRLLEVCYFQLVALINSGVACCVASQEVIRTFLKQDSSFHYSSRQDVFQNLCLYESKVCPTSELVLIRSALYNLVAVSGLRSLYSAKARSNNRKAESVRYCYRKQMDLLINVIFYGYRGGRRKAADAEGGGSASGAGSGSADGSDTVEAAEGAVSDLAFCSLSSRSREYCFTRLLASTVYPCYVSNTSQAAGSTSELFDTLELGGDAKAFSAHDSGRLSSGRWGVKTPHAPPLRAAELSTVPSSGHLSGASPDAIWITLPFESRMPVDSLFSKDKILIIIVRNFVYLLRYMFERRYSRASGEFQYVFDDRVLGRNSLWAPPLFKSFPANREEWASSFRAVMHEAYQRQLLDKKRVGVPSKRGSSAGVTAGAAAGASPRSGRDGQKESGTLASAGTSLDKLVSRAVDDLYPVPPASAREAREPQTAHAMLTTHASRASRAAQAVRAGRSPASSAPASASSRSDPFGGRQLALRRTVEASLLGCIADLMGALCSHQEYLNCFLTEMNAYLREIKPLLMQNPYVVDFCIGEKLCGLANFFLGMALQYENVVTYRMALIFFQNALSLSLHIRFLHGILFDLVQRYVVSVVEKHSSGDFVVQALLFIEMVFGYKGNRKSFSQTELQIIYYSLLYDYNRGRPLMQRIFSCLVSALENGARTSKNASYVVCTQYTVEQLFTVYFPHLRPASTSLRGPQGQGLGQTQSHPIKEKLQLLRVSDCAIYVLNNILRGLVSLDASGLSHRGTNRYLRQTQFYRLASEFQQSEKPMKVLSKFYSAGFLRAMDPVAIAEFLLENTEYLGRRAIGGLIGGSAAECQAVLKQFSRLVFLRHLAAERAEKLREQARAKASLMGPGHSSGEAAGPGLAGVGIGAGADADTDVEADGADIADGAEDLQALLSDTSESEDEPVASWAVGRRAKEARQPTLAAQATSAIQAGETSTRRAGSLSDSSDEESLEGRIRMRLDDSSEEDVLVAKRGEGVTRQDAVGSDGSEDTAVTEEAREGGLANEGGESADTVVEVPLKAIGALAEQPAGPDKDGGLGASSGASPAAAKPLAAKAGLRARPGAARKRSREGVSPKPDVPVPSSVVARPAAVSSAAATAQPSRLSSPVHSRSSFLRTLRFFLSHFYIPGEAQQIDRILASFSRFYARAYRGRPEYVDRETGVILAFAIMMLNTDLHSTQVRNKMTQDAFMQNTLRADKHHILRPDELVAIYQDIQSQPLTLDEIKDQQILFQQGKERLYETYRTELAGSLALCERDFRLLYLLREKAQALQAEGGREWGAHGKSLAAQATSALGDLGAPGSRDTVTREEPQSQDPPGPCGLDFSILESESIALKPQDKLDLLHACLNLMLEPTAKSTLKYLETYTDGLISNVLLGELVLHVYRLLGHSILSPSDVRSYRSRLLTKLSCNVFYFLRRFTTTALFFLAKFQSPKSLERLSAGKDDLRKMCDVSARFSLIVFIMFRFVSCDLEYDAYVALADLLSLVKYFVATTYAANQQYVRLYFITDGERFVLEDLVDATAFNNFISPFVKYYQATTMAFANIGIKCDFSSHNVLQGPELNFGYLFNSAKNVAFLSLMEDSRIRDIVQGSLKTDVREPTIRIPPNFAFLNVVINLYRYRLKAVYLAQLRKDVASPAKTPGSLFSASAGTQELFSGLIQGSLQSTLQSTLPGMLSGSVSGSGSSLPSAPFPGPLGVPSFSDTNMSSMHLLADAEAQARAGEVLSVVPEVEEEDPAPCLSGRPADLLGEGGSEVGGGSSEDSNEASGENSGSPEPIDISAVAGQSSIAEGSSAPVESALSVTPPLSPVGSDAGPVGAAPGLQTIGSLGFRPRSYSSFIAEFTEVYGLLANLILYADIYTRNLLLGAATSDALCQKLKEFLSSSLDVFRAYKADVGAYAPLILHPLAHLAKLVLYPSSLSILYDCALILLDGEAEVFASYNTVFAVLRSSLYRLEAPQKPAASKGDGHTETLYSTSLRSERLSTQSEGACSQCFHKDCSFPLLVAQKLRQAVSDDISLNRSSARPAEVEAVSALGSTAPLLRGPTEISAGGEDSVASGASGASRASGASGTSGASGVSDGISPSGGKLSATLPLRRNAESFLVGAHGRATGRLALSLVAAESPPRPKGGSLSVAGVRLDARTAAAQLFFSSKGDSELPPVASTDSFVELYASQSGYRRLQSLQVLMGIHYRPVAGVGGTNTAIQTPHPGICFLSSQGGQEPVVGILDWSECYERLAYLLRIVSCRLSLVSGDDLLDALHHAAAFPRLGHDEITKAGLGLIDAIFQRMLETDSPHIVQVFEIYGDLARSADPLLRKCAQDLIVKSCQSCLLCSTPGRHWSSLKVKRETWLAVYGQVIRSLLVERFDEGDHELMSRMAALLCLAIPSRAKAGSATAVGTAEAASEQQRRKADSGAGDHDAESLEQRRNPRSSSVSSALSPLPKPLSPSSSSKSQKLLGVQSSPDSLDALNAAASPDSSKLPTAPGSPLASAAVRISPVYPGSPGFTALYKDSRPEDANVLAIAGEPLTDAPRSPDADPSFIRTTGILVDFFTLICRRLSVSLVSYKTIDAIFASALHPLVSRLLEFECYQPGAICACFAEVQAMLDGVLAKYCVGSKLTLSKPFIVLSNVFTAHCTALRYGSPLNASKLVASCLRLLDILSDAMRVGMPDVLDAELDYIFRIEATMMRLAEVWMGTDSELTKTVITEPYEDMIEIMARCLSIMGMIPALSGRVEPKKYRMSTVALFGCVRKCLAVATAAEEVGSQRSGGAEESKSPEKSGMIRRRFYLRIYGELIPFVTHRSDTVREELAVFLRVFM